jgi:hypothetical protein
MMFATGPEDWRILGVLLVGYRKVVSAGSQITTIAGGAGSLGNTARAAWSASKDSIKHGAGFALAFTMSVDALVWFDDYREGKKDFYDLFVALGIDLLKAGLVAGLTSAAVSITLTAAATWLATGVALSMASIAFGTLVVVAIPLAYAVDWMFSEMRINEHLTKLIRDAGSIVAKASPRDYGDAYSTSEWVIMP